MSIDTSRPPLPPFTVDTATQKVRAAEDAWNSRDPQRVALAYTVDSRWRNRAEFFSGRQAIADFLQRKWSKELDYRLIKELWAHDFGEEFYSSPALASNTLLMITRKGVIYSSVVGEAYKDATKLDLGEPYNSSPAFRGARMYMRGKNNLFCFGE